MVKSYENCIFITYELLPVYSKFFISICECIHTTYTYICRAHYYSYHSSCYATHGVRGMHVSLLLRRRDGEQPTHRDKWQWSLMTEM